MKTLRRIWHVLFPEDPVNLRLVLEVQRVLDREEKRRDSYRIYTRQDVHLEALRRRMVEGRSPRVTILAQVAPVWARKGA